MGGVRRGRGVVSTSRKRTKRPSNDATSCAQHVLIASRYSLVIAPRFSNGTPSASNSCRAQPTPMPKMKRPPQRLSTCAVMRAVSSGWRYGTMITVVPSSRRRAFAASQPSSVKGS